jgi:hypothetical protein
VVNFLVAAAAVAVALVVVVVEKDLPEKLLIK